MDPQMQQYALIGGIVLALLLVVLVVRAVLSHRERRRLRDRFGREYDRTVEARGSKRRAVRDLRERQHLRSQLELTELNEADRDLVRRHMASLQYRFVENPAEVMLSTGRVMTEVLRARGYPVADQREKALRLFSVDHPHEAGAVRTAVTGEFHGDVELMRRTFVGVRDALLRMAGIRYVVDDALGAPRDMRPKDLQAGHEQTRDATRDSAATMELQRGHDQTEDLNVDSTAPLPSVLEDDAFRT